MIEKFDKRLTDYGPLVKLRKMKGVLKDVAVPSTYENTDVKPTIEVDVSETTIPCIRIFCFFSLFLSANMQVWTIIKNFYQKIEELNHLFRVEMDNIGRLLL